MRLLLHAMKGGDEFLEIEISPSYHIVTNGKHH